MKQLARPARAEDAMVVGGSTSEPTRYTPVVPMVWIACPCGASMARPAD